MNLNDLHAFVRVVELGTITAAADEAGVGKSTISRAIARLEEELGMELIRRTARAFAVTDRGRLVYSRAKGPLGELADLEVAVMDAADEPSGTLVISAPHDLARSTQICALITEFRELHPAVSVALRLENRMVQLVEEGVDVAIRAHRGPIPGEAGLLARSLASPEAGLFASPRYLDKRPAPQRPEDLAEHDLVLHQAFIAGGARLRSTNGEACLGRVTPAVLVNDFGMLHTLARTGAGIALVSLEDAARAHEAGELVRVLPDFHVTDAKITLLWPESRNLSPRVRAFVDLAAARMG